MTQCLISLIQNENQNAFEIIQLMNNDTINVRKTFINNLLKLTIGFLFDLKQ